jgi:hypothetical protein
MRRKTFVQTFWVCDAKLLFKHFGREARLLFKHLGAKQDLCSIFLDANKVFC